MYDYHAHTTYSDGSFLRWMVGAAEEAGLDGIGLADHCTVSDQSAMVRRREDLGFALDVPVVRERRRRAIDRLNDERDIAVFDAVEIDYHPDDEAAIEAFLAETEFDYAVGSVHFVDDRYVGGSEFADAGSERRREVLERYYDQVVAMADSELFAVAGHVDLPRRNDHLRGESTREQYDRVAEAFADSRTVPEINAGRSSEGYFHPAPEFAAALRERGVRFTAGTDAHGPEAVRESVPRLRERFDDLGVDPVVLGLPTD